MKLVVLFALVAIAAAQPVKRFAGFGLAGLSTVGGNIGCVVTGNKLFVNGLEGRELTADEQAELHEYEEKLAAVRAEIKKMVEERRAEAEARRRNGESSVGSTTDNATERKTPQPPKKPSFCSESVTTQYIFDGCKVQNNAVYVGNTFARKLTESEIEDLKKFDKEMSAYQKTVSSNLEEQLNNLFAGAFAGRPQISRSTTTTVSSTGGQSIAEPPKTPNFCSLIA